MVTDDIKIGIIGFSSGNGHPFSFSSIINGYSDEGYKDSGWDVIHQYLKLRDKSEFCFPGVKCTNAWNQDANITDKLCKASKIPRMVSKPADLIKEVDAVIIARDDYHNHYAQQGAESLAAVIISISCQ